MAAWHRYLGIFPVLFCLTSGFMFPNGVMFPRDPYVYIGNDLLLTCNLTQPLVEDSKSMYFTRKANELIPMRYTRILSTRSIQLRLPVISPDDEGNYICKLNKTTGSKEVIANQFVQVEHKARKVKEINCTVYNWLNMTCTWELGVDYLHKQWIKVELVWAVFIMDNVQYDCPHLTMTSCTWTQYDGRDHFRSNMVYTMGIIINNTKTRDTKTSTFVIHTSTIVKPASVSDIQVSTNSTCLSLTWNHPDKYHDKVFRIYYFSEWDDPYQGRVVNQQEKVFETCSLAPYTWYTVTVSCRPLDLDGRPSGFWSEEKDVTVLTSEDVPKGAPEIQSGSYAEYPCGLKDCRTVVIYWRPLDASESNGIITNYHVTLTDLDSGETSRRDVGNISSTEYSLHVERTYLFTVQAATKAGMSKYFSEISIPSKTSEPVPPVDFIVEIAKTKTKKRILELTWEPPADKYSLGQRVISYTLYWCIGSQHTQKCRKPINWTILSSKISAYNLSSEKDSLPNTLFGISMEIQIDGKILSSGIKWNNCLFYKRSAPLIAPKNFRLSPYHPETSIKVEWDPMKCHESGGYVTKYTLYYCHAMWKQNCTGELHFQAVKGHSLNAVVNDLDPGHSYMFWMEAHSSVGAGPQTDGIYVEIPLYNLHTGRLVGIIIGIFIMFILMLFGVIFIARRCYQTVKKNFKPYDFIMPKFDVPLPAVAMPKPVPSGATSPDDDDESIYAKIDEGSNQPLTPSSPGSTSVDMPLINNNPHDSSFKDHYNADGINRYGRDTSGALFNPADLFARLHPMRSSADSTNRQNYIDNKKLSTFGTVFTPHGTGKSNSTLASVPFVESDHCSPYSCVDVVNTPSSVKVRRKSFDENMRELHSVGSVHSDPTYATNDLSGVPITNKHMVSELTTGRTTDCPPHLYNIQPSHDGTKNVQCYCDQSLVSSDKNSVDSTEDMGYRLSDRTADPNMSVTSYCQMSANTCSNQPSQCYSHQRIPQNCPTPVSKGYVSYDQMRTQRPNCHSDDKKLKKCNTELLKKELNVPPGSSDVSEVVKVPPHFYGSLSLLDCGASTEL